MDSVDHFKSLSADALQLLVDAPSVERAREPVLGSSLPIPVVAAERSVITPIWLGQIPYVESMLATQALADSSKASGNMAQAPKEKIEGLEYPLTITLGRRADPLRDIKASIRILRDRNIPIVGVERGGQATLHNPGQLVIYPHINLRERGLKVKEYVAVIEVVTKRFLQRFGIEAFCKGDEPGLHTVSGKIAFFGVRVQHGFTSHGLSINVRNNLDDFAMIRSCGKSEEAFSRMQDYGVTAPLSFLFKCWCEEFFKEPIDRPI